MYSEVWLGYPVTYTFESPLKVDRIDCFSHVFRVCVKRDLKRERKTV